MARAIDGDSLELKIASIATLAKSDAQKALMGRVLYCIEQMPTLTPPDHFRDITNMPTLTPPSEWVRVETPPTTQGWYHIAVLDLKTGKYTVEQDLYSIELAKAHGFEPGFCKANRWEERERIDYWCRFPAPPDRRPPKAKKDGDL